MMLEINVRTSNFSTSNVNEYDENLFSLTRRQKKLSYLEKYPFGPKMESFFLKSRSLRRWSGVVLCRIFRHTHSRVKKVAYIVKNRSQFKRRFTANHVEVIVPVSSQSNPIDLIWVQITRSVRYVPLDKAFLFSLPITYVTSRPHFERYQRENGSIHRLTWSYFGTSPRHSDFR